LGYAASKITQTIDDPQIEITLTTNVAYGSYLLANHLHLSGVIATASAGLMVGNFGAKKGMSARTRTALESFWEYIAFAMNSLVFLLIGLEVHINALAHAWRPVLLAIAAVLIGRSHSVYSLVAVSNFFAEKIPLRWQHVMVWGGLRGALALALALSLDNTFPYPDRILDLLQVLRPKSAKGRRNFHAGCTSTLQDTRTAKTMKILVVSAIVVISIGAWTLAFAPQPLHGSDAGSDVRTPVLVELFTSEGCSSCPPADRFLQTLDGQPVQGAEMIVLSEHVDYWNHIGWKDPYSASFYSQRQSAYANRFGLDSVYTPQMVVDGTSEFVGSNSGLADKAFRKALSVPKLSVHLTSVSADASNILRAHLETRALDASFSSREADVYVAVALNRAESQVSAGENAGHRLAHVSVVRSLTKVGALKQGQVLAQDVQLKLGPGSESSGLRLIAFVQEARQGRVLGAASMPVNTR
jgi:hypothetical protein